MSIPEVEPYDLPPGDRPQNVVTWTVDPARAVLLVHDMQHFFLRFFPDVVRQQLLHNVAALRDRCRAAGIPVAYTTQPGRMTTAQRGLLRHFWGNGMTDSPADRDVAPPLEPAPSDWVFTKWRYSAFCRSDLADRMRDNDRDQLIVCGIYAHIGVQATAVDAFSNDIQPFVVDDAIADFSAGHHRAATRFLTEQCAAVISTGEFLP
ncbi:MAG TPA: isochorismatase family protein [Actinophytocola sp.]